MALPGFIKNRTEFTVVQALSGSNTTTILFDFGVVPTQQVFVRAWWEAKDDNDNTKGALGMRQAILRNGGAALAIVGQGTGDTTTTAGAMVTPSFTVSGTALQMLTTNDGAITGEIMFHVQIDY